MDVDITRQAQIILSGAARAQNMYPEGISPALLLRMLHGSADKRLPEMGLTGLPTFGILANVDRGILREYISQLVEQGFLVQNGDQKNAPVRLGPEAPEVLFGGLCVTARLDENLVRNAKGRRRKKRREGPKADLYQSLRTLRTELAAMENVPAFCVFSNATLEDMVRKQPTIPAEFLEVYGVGPRKAERYGDVFLAFIRFWKNSTQ